MIRRSSTSPTSPPRPSAAAPPPPGVTPNFENPPDHYWTANVAGMAVCVALVTLFFILRCLSRWKFGLPRRAEDWVCPIAWLSTITYISSCFLMARYGEGHHTWDLTAENYKKMLMWLYVSSTLYIPATFLAKTTLLLIEARVFAVYGLVSKGIIWYIWFMLFAYLPVQFVKIFICTPISFYWDSSTSGSCLDQPKVFLADTALAIVTDLTILVIPIPLVWKLRISIQKKIRIVAMLSAGGCAMALACYRLYRLTIFQNSTDVSGDFVIFTLLGSIEMTIGVICACLPAINMLFEHCRKPRQSPNRPRTRTHPSSSSHQRRRDIMLASHSQVGTERSSGDLLRSPMRQTAGCCSGPNFSTGDMSDCDQFHGGTNSTSGTCEQGQVIAALDHTMLQELLHYGSEDAKREGWLASDDHLAGGNGGSSGCLGRDQDEGIAQVDISPGRALMRSSTYDSKGIIIPGRIWDGGQGASPHFPHPNTWAWGDGKRIT